MTTIKTALNNHTPYFALLAVIFAAATGPIAIRATQNAGVPSLFIIATRLIFTSLVLAPIVLKNDWATLKTLRRRDWLLLIAAGTVFAINLLLLFFALEYTSVLITTVMRRTSPLWVIWLEVIFLNTVFTRRVWWGLLLTLAGSIVVVLGSGVAVEAGSQPILGAGLALLGSVSMGLYLLLGRFLRHKLSWLTYSWLVFAVAAFVVTLILFLSKTPVTGYSSKGYLWILLVTLITQFVGHIPINITLRYFPATYLSVIMQTAVIASAILAFFLFHEIPTLWQMIGSVTIMGGVWLVSWRRG